MKIFSWMRSKRNGNEVSNNHNPQLKSYDMMHDSCKEEFSDWPNGLLAIGTFGNNNALKHSHEKLEQQIERELRLVMNEEHNIPLDSPEKEDLAVEQLLEEGDGDGGGGARLQMQSSVVQRGEKDIQSEKRKRGIGKTSLSFLIKKALLCRGGFVAAPPINRDPLPDPKLDHSTMEKILRVMLHKKIYPQRPPTTTPKKYLDMAERESEEQESEKGSHESKWVKTDSEYIVLEI